MTRDLVYTILDKIVNYSAKIEPYTLNHVFGMFSYNDDDRRGPGNTVVVIMQAFVCN